MKFKIVFCKLFQLESKILSFGKGLNFKDIWTMEFAVLNFGKFWLCGLETLSYMIKFWASPNWKHLQKTAEGVENIVEKKMQQTGSFFFLSNIVDKAFLQGIENLYGLVGCLLFGLGIFINLT